MALGWKCRIVIAADKMAWSASVLRPSAILVLEGGPEWSDDVVDSVRGATSSPVVILGALSAQRALTALRSGVDAIIPPGLTGEETLARVLAIVRRSEILAPTTRYLESGRVRLDLWQNALYLDGEALHLTTIEFRLLAYLMRNAENTMESRRIVEHVWQASGSGGENALRIAIGRLRSKLGDDARTSKVIAAVRGRGYRFVPPVVEVSDDARSAIARHAQVELLDSLATFATRMGMCSEEAELYESLVDQLVASGFADAAAIHAVREGRLILKAHSGLSDAWVATARDKAIDERLASARAVQASSPVQFTSSSRTFPLTHAAIQDEDQGEYIFLPIEVDAEVRACLGIVRRASRDFDAGSLAYLRTAISMLASFMSSLARQLDG